MTSISNQPKITSLLFGAVLQSLEDKAFIYYSNVYYNIEYRIQIQTSGDISTTQIIVIKTILNYNTLSTIKKYDIKNIDRFKIDHTKIFELDLNCSEILHTILCLYKYAASPWYRRYTFAKLVSDFKKIKSNQLIAKVLDIKECAIHIASYI